MTAWDFCVQDMSVQPNVHMLRALLETQLRKCTVLRPLFMSIEGSSPGSHRREYKYLYESAHREIDRRQSEIVRQQLRNCFPAAQTAATVTKATKREERKAAAAKAKTNKKKDGQPPADAATAAVPSAGKEALRRFATIGKCS